ncbi:3-dehydroquinate synthase [Lactiplantibacillus dongliensis]|uniref:3-dehydroquinate synthase n=1 Tax=Lactiplantibacillus dongliensis TaxID=2559919 RepID=A0ABW1R4W4_9LACO|nr:3-dehydroquinate synthase [Lactiplantibacillus dongliensis]
MTTIEVKTTTANYAVKVKIGSLMNVAQAIKTVWTPRRIALITDTTVGALYADQVQTQLMAGGFAVTVLTVPTGEASKSWTQTMRLVEALSQAHFTRNDGVVGDLAGFVASIYMRGIRLIQLPTSLLAQVDSSVGGKTALDLPTGKNLVGSFYQPDLVLIDPQTLTTLPQRMLVEGYGEVVKCAALVGGDFWELLQSIQQPDDILLFAPQLIARSVSFKAQIVRADEKEGGQRQLLNFGHTIGHAVELLGQGKWMHGEAVAMGLVAVCRVFEAQGLTPVGTANAIAARLAVVGLPTELPDLALSTVLEAMRHDKKVHGDQLTWVYLTALGQPQLQPVPLTDLAAWVAPVLNAAA